MKLQVNGEPYEHGGEATLASLLRELGADGARVAVLIGDVVVPRDERDATRLKDGDRIEILTFAGGG